MACDYTPGDLTPSSGPALGSGDRRIPEVHWPANLA